MKLDQCTWYEIDEYLSRSDGIIIPTGSTEQHGPVGLIGTDAICAERIALEVGEQTGALVVPTLQYTPAPFNMSFAGTISISESLFENLISEIVEGLSSQGFGHIYFLNGHGANLAPIKRACQRFEHLDIRIKSWWDFDEVNQIRHELYGDWEGMHATPSEIAITRHEGRIIHSELADDPPERLSREYILEHSGDRHGPPDEHRKQFPDGRVGSHSALGLEEHGKWLLEAASKAISEDYRQFLSSNGD